jgi:hypothetical protein
MAHTIYPYLRRSFFKFSIKIVVTGTNLNTARTTTSKINPFLILSRVAYIFFFKLQLCISENDSWVGGSAEHLPFGHILKTILAEGQ